MSTQHTTTGGSATRPAARPGRRLATALLTLAALVVPSAAATAAEPGDTVHIGSKQGYGGTGLFPIWYETPPTGDPDAWAYCVEHDVSARTNVEGTVGGLDDFLGDNHLSDPAVAGKVLWVLAHSYPALSLADFGEASGVPDISRNDAIEATQYAIWRYTDLTWDASWSWESEDSETAYWYLVDGANASSGTTPEDLAVTASITAPATPGTAGTLVGPFVVSTNQPTVTASVDPATALVDASGTPVDPAAVVDGQELYLDLRGSSAAGSATVTVSAVGSSATGRVVSVPAASGGTPTAESHAQSIILVVPSTATTSARATARWSAAPGAPVPAIGTSLVDAADGDRVLPASGGTVVDTVSYENLTPGTEYTLVGELVRRSDGTPTGITGAVTFTPGEPSGSVEVTFVVPAGHAGESLVAFETLHEGADGEGPVVAEHRDIEDAAQTVTVEEDAATPTPSDEPSEEPSPSVTPSDRPTPGGTPSTAPSTPASGTPGPTPTGSRLPDTGAESSAIVAGLAVLALALGGGAAVARRRLAR
ncbi:LPXTG-motif cell wall-anchored protein/TQXA domain-containing protein [Salana multivorans]|uniref:LPXTG-motif cell wall-anchored protein/TQXA domain-containing protein n=1 Tax=Salana multivorans TaxID=120377 RepID=A0A3N2D0U2_9MICO|nr:VaFE repeat-containing surface-anchored protein [Salana multivorans]ROR93094.1 LPXTG-motif cell wall-anchored protein/TQXA domain-containing protein [Salana multivorans]